MATSFEEIERWYDSGKYRTAYTAASEAGLFHAHASVAPSHAVLAGRVLRVCGAPRRARKLLLTTWRRHRSDPDARVAALYELAGSSPLSALVWMDTLGEPDGAASEQVSDWMALRAMCLVELRDFRAAERAWEVARERHADAWTWCVRALLDDARDQPEAALVAVERARERSPWYRPAVEIASRVLVRTRRAAEARTLLTSAVEHLESGSTYLILSMLQREAGELDGAVASLHRAIALLPVMERELHDHAAMSLSYAHYLRGEVDLSVRLMRLVADDRSRDLADRIAATPGVRKKLAVPHVPQHHRTCAPATLTAIAQLWGEQVDHAELAEEICHDGTPAGNERKWADERGFVTRQLTVTWEAARALIDGGIPIALTTSFTLGAHLQPVAGYDERRRSLLVVEPGAVGVVELDWERLAESQAPFGPRGMVFVPTARAAVLDRIELPDSALYDHHHAIEMSLQRHDRAGAQAAYDALVAAAPPGHYLRHHARRALSSYDGDERGVLSWVAGLCERHAAHPFLRMCELASLHGHASDERRTELARGLLADHRDDAAVLVACARFLVGRGEAVRAYGAARRAVALAPQHPTAYSMLADLAWIAGDRTAATRLYRFASCLAEGDEGAAWQYFAASVITGAVDDALDHLRDRVARMKARSGAPAQTLCDAYRAVGRGAEGMKILDEAAAAHPGDGMLLVVAAEQHRVTGNVSHAQERLEAARGKVASPVWRRAAAMLAVQRGDLDGARELRRQLVEEDPLDLASQHEYVALLERAGAGEVARAHVTAVAAQFPFHIPLAQLCDQVMCDVDPAAARAHLEAFVERQPRNAWALYRLSDWHVKRGELAAARQLLERAQACTDDVASAKVSEAALDMREGRRDEAMALLRDAIALDVDTAGAVSGLLELARDGKDARDLLDTIGAALARQGSNGVGLAAYAAGLRGWLDPLTSLARLRDIRVARSHQWAAWSVEIDALLGAGRLDEALALATAATERYGHDVRAWRQLAEVEGERGDHRAQIAALERARELDPRATDLLRRIAEASIATDETARAREAIERALAEEPFSETNHGFLARIAQLERDDAAALRHIARAVELQPEYVWAWSRWLEWSTDESVFVAARAAIARDPRAIAPRLVLAERAPDLDVDERLALFDEAIRIAPDRADLSDEKAMLLARHERWDEALAACRPAFWGTTPPSTLQGRAAWVRFARGEREAAITDMLAVIRRTPSYGWAIEQVLAWGKAVRAPIKTAQRLVEAAPENALAHAVLGEALREGKKLEEAEASYERALEIDGTNQLARLGLYDVRFDQGKYEAAEPLLDALDNDNPYVMSRRVQICAVTGRLDDADAALARMLRKGVRDAEPLEDAMVGYRTAKASARVEALLDRLLAEPDASPATAAAWWTHVGRHRSLFRRWRQIKRLPPSKASSLAAAFHVEAYGDSRDFLGLLLFLLLNYRIARARTDVWGSAGYSLLAAGRLWLARWWLRDYERRDDAKPWMLNILARALVAGRQITRAYDVWRRALTLPPDHTTSELRLLTAPIEALSDEEAAARSVSASRVRPWSDEQKFIGGFAEALIAYRRGPRDDAGRDTLVEACRVVWARHGQHATRICHELYEYVMVQIGRTLGRQRGNWLARMHRIKRH